MDTYLYRNFVKNLRMLFCQLKISALTHQNNLLDFGKVLKELKFIPSSETPVSTRSRSPKYQGKESILPLYTESQWVSMKKFTVQLFELYFQKLAIASH